ncbi:calcium/sodium antiporter [Candidatus Woesebacteria bacterium]|nr:MAG: calcium/sodium antiporter [Candidatus Woesebacteria bacterium]
MLLILILVILVLSLVLIKSADVVVTSIIKIAKRSHVNKYAISAVILAVGTSFPELFVSITSAIEGNPRLALGIVLGSNIANISLVAGITALITGKINVSRDFLRRDVSIALVAGILPMILLIDGSLGRIDGLILLSIYLAYATSLFKARFTQIGERIERENYIHRFLSKPVSIDKEKTKAFGQLFLGVALMLFASDLIVNVSELLAESARISVFVIGLIVLAAGTSLPEFAFSLRSIDNKQPTMFFGNLLGSIIANSTLIIGVTALISPIAISVEHDYFLVSITFVALFLTFWYFIKSKFSLERWEAVFLLVIYLIFLILQFVNV